jgi:hypothetical protein
MTGSSGRGPTGTRQAGAPAGDEEPAALEPASVIRSHDALAATGLLVLGGAAAYGAFASTAADAPLFLLFAAVHLVAAVGVAFRKGWARIAGLVLAGLWLLNQLVVALSILLSLVAPAAVVGVTPLTVGLTAFFTILAGGTFVLLLRQRTS